MLKRLLGRLDKVENRYVGMKSRGCYETPGGTILMSGHRAIESITQSLDILDGITKDHSDAVDRTYGETNALLSRADSLSRSVNGIHLPHGSADEVHQLTTQAAELIMQQGIEQAREVLWQRTRAQLADPDNGASGELKMRRDEALQRYLDRGSNEDWDELQRLNALLRNAKEN